jgi:hypothetical protein
VTRRLPFALAATLLATAAGCAREKKSLPPPTTAAVSSILAGPAQAVAFADARRSIRALYVHHPEIRNFVSRDVYYTPQTRDKVLAVCRRGGPAADARERETSRVFACAPLIFFFYSFGTRKHVAESVDVARALYRYGVGIRGPYDPQPALTNLLRSWGVR